MLAQHSNSTCITPDEGLDAQHDFDNSALATEGSNKIQQSRDDCNGAEPSGEGSSKDVPHSKEN